MQGCNNGKGAGRLEKKEGYSKWLAWCAELMYIGWWLEACWFEVCEVTTKVKS